MQGPSKQPHLFNTSNTQPPTYVYGVQVNNQQPRFVAPFEVSNGQQQRPPQVVGYPVYAYANQPMYYVAPVAMPNVALQQQNQQPQLAQQPIDPLELGAGLKAKTEKDIEEEVRLEKFRKLKLFPLFGDKNLAEFSCNYHLYFELFRKIIRLCFVLLIFSGIVELVLLKLKENDEWEYLGYQCMIYFYIMIATLIIYIPIWIREESLLGKDKILAELQWTENMFAVRIDGLQKNVQKEDVIAHFNQILKKRPNLTASEGHVKDVVFLHDLAEYYKLEKKLEVAKGNAYLPASLEFKYNLSKVTEYQGRMRAMEKEILGNVYFKGKVIVILNSIAAKVALMRWSENRSWFSISSSPAPLTANTFKVLECEEPGDLKYENLHYPECSLMCRHIVAFLICKFTLYIGFFIIFMYTAVNAERDAEQELSDTELSDSDKTGKMIGGVVIALIDMGFGALYSICEGSLYIRLSETASDMRQLTYSMVSSALIEGFIQGLVLPLTFSRWSPQYIIIPATIFGKRIGFIIISFLLNIEFFTDLVNDYKYSFSTVIQILVKVATYFRNITTNFDITSGTENITGILYLAFAFLVRCPLLILPATILILLLSAVIEKYILITYSTPAKRKSPYFMAKTFRILHNGIIAILLGSLANLFTLGVDLSKFGEYTEYKYWIFIAFGTTVGGILIFFFFGKYLFSFDLMQNMYKTRRDVEYDQVSKNFFLTFRNTNPGSIIQDKYFPPAKL